MTSNNALFIVLKNFIISLGTMLVGFLVGKLFVPREIVNAANALLVGLMLFLLLIVLLSKKGIIPNRFSIKWVYAFTFVDGILMYPAFEYYFMELGFGLFLSIFFGAVTLFGVLTFIAYRKEGGAFLKFGNILISALIALVVLGIFNLFTGEIPLYYSIGGLAIFSGFVLYDINKLKYDVENGNILNEDDLSIYVLDIYLDFINILLDALNIGVSLKD